jgi:hypothetical protein
MSELDKLENFLKNNGIGYKRIDENTDTWGRHQINVFDSDGNIAWDAICQRGSYGFENGLLEIYGNIVDEEKDGDSVVGWLTAKDVIARLGNFTRGAYDEDEQIKTYL